MDFYPTEDQQALRGAVRELLARDFTREHLQAAGDAPETARLGSFRLWSALSDMGVFTLRLPESEGGMGGGLVEAALVFEELGRALVPGPLVGTVLAAGRLPGIDPGAPVGVVDAGARPLLVEHLEDLSALVVLSGATAGVVDPASLPATRVEHPLDPLTPVWEVATLPAGDALSGTAGDAELWRREGAVLTAALQAGIAASTTDLAVAYAKQREQFGRPIGSFQAVKHICADMFARAELATVAVEAAAVAVDDQAAGDPVDTARAVGVAKLLADEAASANGRACVQVHGGMGFTWEVVAHFYLKRAWVHATQFGSEDETAEALAQSL